MTTRGRTVFSRREWLNAAVLAGGTFCTGLDKIAIPLSSFVGFAVEQQDAKLVSLVPFIREGSPPLNTPLGAELDGRLYTNLSEVVPEQEVVLSKKFYVRTRVSALLDKQNLSLIECRGFRPSKLRLAVKSVRDKARPMGLHLMECAGNTKEGRFGLMSAANWAGVPFTEAIDFLPRIRDKSRILISGFDTYASQSASSLPGASWIFSLADLHAAGAFFAIAMNDEPLTPDHGAPLRLVVPGWYGCVCIKWINEISVVGSAETPTDQMKEFAARTHQPGLPGLAQDFAPATIDQAAMPLRVEKWSVAGKIHYRVIGILWGGCKPVKKVQIRFNPEEDYVPVTEFRHATNDPWTFWRHVWTPAAPGNYLIRLQIADQGVRTRRLDAGFYVREVEISEV